ncbi:MAG TPA: threonine synthase [Thermoplasmata archaeon]|nr:threonine synthase [Thermoplasmata archaeon]
MKNEGQNPTGSFKDRGMTVGVTEAVALGRERVICASTGNTAASLAAYAARAHLECVVLVPAGGVAQGKLAQAYFEGARIVGLRGSFDDAMNVVVDTADRLDAYVLNSINPYRIEGQKTAAFEVFEQLGGNVPDWLMCPVGNGGNLAAYWKGFQELKALGATERLPRLVGVQAEGAAPIADAILEGREEIRPVEKPETVASAIRIGNPANWRKTVRAIRGSGGLALKLPDPLLVEAQTQLAREEGIFVEPASAASVAGAMRLAREGTLRSEETVVCVCTGHGLKDPEAALRERVEVAVVEPTVKAILSALGGSRR